MNINPSGYYWLPKSGTWLAGTVNNCNCDNNFKQFTHHSTAVPPPTLMTQAISNSGASANYIHPSYKQYYYNITTVKNGPPVRVANGETITATKRVTIPLSTALSTRAQISHIIPNLRTGNLLSIGKLCDDSCLALFSKDTPQVFNHVQQVLTGYRNHTNVLWDVLIIPTTIENTTPNTHIVPFRHPQKNSIIRQAKTKHDLSKYLHACAFSPNPSTLLRAVKRGHFDSWPNLTPSLITKHLPKSLATSKGHMGMQQKNCQSTKAKTKHDLSKYLHACAFIPNPSTLIRAVKRGHF